VNTSVFLKKAAREARCAWTRADDDLYRELAAQLDAWIAKQWETTPAWVACRRRNVEIICGCFDCQEYGDGKRRHEAIKRKMEIATREEESNPKLDPADALDEEITVEIERKLKTQHVLQADVEALAAGHEALSAQVAALIKQNGNGTQS
jgi:hypothetical protein